MREIPKGYKKVFVHGRWVLDMTDEEWERRRKSPAYSYIGPDGNTYHKNDVSAGVDTKFSNAMWREYYNRQ